MLVHIVSSIGKTNFSWVLPLGVCVRMTSSFREAAEAGVNVGELNEHSFVPSKQAESGPTSTTLLGDPRWTIKSCP
jgi:hypothetical protein